MKTVLIWLCVAAVLFGLFGAYSTAFPGTNSPAKGAVGGDSEVTERLRDHVLELAQGTTPRSQPAPIAAAGDYVERRLIRDGHDVKTFALGRGATTKTIVAEIPGTKYAREVVILASHFDGPRGSPGADSGASGAAVLLEVARGLLGSAHERTLRFVMFPDGYARHDGPDSAAGAYAAECKSRGETIAAVIYLDSVGVFDDGETQSYPFPLMLAFPSRADFLGVIGGYSSRDLTAKTTELLRGSSGIAIEGMVLPEFAPGVGFSPHKAFWSAGFPAVMLTDTGTWRSARIASPSDTHDRLDYVRMTRLVTGLSRAVGQLAKKATLSV